MLLWKKVTNHFTLKIFNALWDFHFPSICFQMVDRLLVLSCYSCCSFSCISCLMEQVTCHVFLDMEFFGLWLCWNRLVYLCWHIGSFGAVHVFQCMGCDGFLLVKRDELWHTLICLSGSHEITFTSLLWLLTFWFLSFAGLG